MSTNDELIPLRVPAAQKRLIEDAAKRRPGRRRAIGLGAVRHPFVCRSASDERDSASYTRYVRDNHGEGETLGVRSTLGARSIRWIASRSTGLGGAPPLQGVTFEVRLVFPAQHSVGLVHFRLR